MDPNLFKRRDVEPIQGRDSREPDLLEGRES
jgi:hypothetical protein